MKAIVAILTLVASTAFGFTYKNDPTWATFKNKFLKRYDTLEEEIYRYKIFLQNMQLASHYNEREPEASYGMTRFSDKLASELFSFDMSNPPTIEGITTSLNDRITLSNNNINNDDDDLPESFDWRIKGAVTNVKDQGSCGSCWAFSTVGCTEGAHYVASNKLIALSEQELVDCDNTCLACNGGWVQMAFAWAKSKGGFMNETAYPYTAVKGTCLFDASQAVVRVNDVHIIVPNKPEKMQEYLMTYGPLSVALDASKFHSYLSGIMNGTDCSTLTTNHAVLAVGWGVDSVTGTKYWIIKNSWGPLWGENGYIRIVRGSNACNVERTPVAVTTD